MPNTYVRKKNTAPRGEWSAEDLRLAINAVLSKQMGMNEAAKNFRIPKTTLKRRLRKGDLQKTHRLGPDSLLGALAEEKLANHIKKLQASGFAPTREEVRIMAYNLAVCLGKASKFNEEKGKAGFRWLQSFLRRRSDIVVRKSENTSIARVRGMTREVVRKYFEQLQQILTKYSLFDKPGNIFNADESGLQLNTKAGDVLAEKGSKSVPCVSPGEKGETITVLTCCNAEGVFLPPFCIFKGKNVKNDWKDGMPPGSHIAMNEKSAYVNAEIFYDWLKNHFCPRKPAGATLLLVDGHTSHTTNLEMLEFAEENNIIIFCLPPHTTHFLQPLDRAFFKSLKGYFYEACRQYMRSNPNRKLNRMQFGKLLGESWGKAATVQNAVSAFSATGIVPFNPGTIPDHAFLSEINDSDSLTPPSTEPGPSGVHPKLISVDITKKSNSQLEQNQSGPTSKEDIAEKDITPGKLLDAISPVPVINPAVRKVRKQIMGPITTAEHISHRKEVENRKLVKENKTKGGKRMPKKTRKDSSSSSSSQEMKFNDSSSGEEHFSDIENECVGCKEDYRMTKKKEEWLQCISCSRWLHEGCSTFLNLCQKCGNILARKKEDISGGPSLLQ